MNQIKKFTQKDRYGNTTTYEFESPVKPVDQTALMKAAMEQMQSGMQVPQMEMSMGIPEMHPGEPKGSDTVPAWLTPGEFVMNAEAVREFGPEIEQMNNHGRAIQAAQGGTIPGGYATGGHVMGHRMPGGHFMGGDPNVVHASAGQMIDEFGLGTLPGEGEQQVQEQQSLAEALSNLTSGFLTTDTQRKAELAAMQPQAPEEPAAPPPPSGTEYTDAGVMGDVSGVMSEPETQEDIAASLAFSENPDEVAEVVEEPPKPSVIETADEKTLIDLDTLITNPDDITKLPEQDTENTLRFVTQAGEEEAKANPGFFDKILTGLKETAGELFDPAQLAQTAIMYLGSRAMGYDHSQSINFAGKQHFAGYQQKQVTKAETAKAEAEAKRKALAAEKKRVQDLKDHEYKKRLEADIDAEQDKIKRQQEIADDNLKHQRDLAKEDRNYQRDVAKIKYKHDLSIQKGDYQAARTHNFQLAKIDYEHQLKSADPAERQKAVNTATKGLSGSINDLLKLPLNQDDDGNPILQVSSDAVAARLANEITDAGGDLNQAHDLTDRVVRAAIQYQKQNPDKTVTQLMPFYEQEIYRGQGGAKNGFKDVSAENQATLTQTIADSLRASTPGLEDIPDNAIAAGVYNKGWAEWSALDKADKDYWNDRAIDGTSGFYLYLKDNL